MPDGHPFADLAATWRGAGEGEYPTIADFAYTEELVITPVHDRPLAHWRSTTRDVETGEPRHAESGFLRATTTPKLELVVAHGFGIVEAAAGSFDGGVLALRSSGLLGTASAKQVDEVERRYELDGETLRYAIAMSAVGIPLTHHLRAELRRG
ncbi:MAG: FABP family protein [Actinomycetota bacterium]|nr:FABP family protein [Actinomycetota bacterium]